MDAFYASVEVRERPELAGRPVVVAGGSNPAGDRGVVLSASYQARAFGVRSAMPVAHARRLCPQAEFIPPHFPRYAEVSRGVMALFREVTPLVEPLSLDEAFLDVAGSLRRLGMGPAGIGEWIRGQVYDAHRVSCSVGVGTSKFIAKLASGLSKPDGLLVVPADGVLEFLHPLPLSALWGVGCPPCGVPWVWCAPNIYTISPTAAMSGGWCPTCRRSPWARRRPSPTMWWTERCCGASCCGWSSVARLRCAAVTCVVVESR
jgi:nucleotidyltransferase/DNA polymerase involved in DNA repair